MDNEVSLQDDGYESLLNLRPEYLTRRGAGEPMYKDQKQCHSNDLKGMNMNDIDTIMGDGQSKESTSKQSDSLGGEDVNKAIMVQAMGKSESSSTGFSDSGTGNHNLQGTEQSPN